MEVPVARTDGTEGFELARPKLNEGTVRDFLVLKPFYLFLKVVDCLFLDHSVVLVPVAVLAAVLVVLVKSLPS